MAAILSFFRPGVWEVVVILLVVLIIFGAARLPAIGRALGEAIKGFRSASKDGDQGPSC